MFGFAKKIPNPAIKKFEKRIKKRGLLLVKADYSRADFVIEDLGEFINFAKRSGCAGTIFVWTGMERNYYFYVANGVIVQTSLVIKVKKR